MYTLTYLVVVTIAVKTVSNATVSDEKASLADVSLRNCSSFTHEVSVVIATNNMNMYFAILAIRGIEIRYFT